MKKTGIQTRYQTIDVYKAESGRVLLYLNGVIQVDSRTQKESHALLATLPLQIVPDARDILILGGGDGLVARDFLKSPGVREITLVELDPDMVRFSAAQPDLKKMNEGALGDPRVKVIIGDAMRFVRESPKKFDVVVDDADLFVTAQSSPVGENLDTFVSLRGGKLLKEGGVATMSYAIDENFINAMGMGCRGFDARDGRSCCEILLEILSRHWKYVTVRAIRVFDGDENVELECHAILSNTNERVLEAL